MFTSVRRETIVGLILLCIQTVYAVWPQPSQISTGDSVRQLASDFKIEAPAGLSGDHEISSAIQRAMERVTKQAIELHTVNRGANLSSAIHNSHPLDRLVVHVNVPKKGPATNKRTWRNLVSRGNSAPKNLAQSPAFYLETKTEKSRPEYSVSSQSTRPLGNVDESYTLFIEKDNGGATLEAKSATGVVRGLASFTQLVYRLPSENKVLYIKDLPLKINDKPAYPYRGIMLDTSRNYLAPEVIKAQINAMELFKLNQLHWHITDTASWPLSLTSKNLGQLAKAGAYSPESVYSPQTITSLVGYAARRGVNIIIEIDMPGHQYMGVAQYPGDLITCGAEMNWLQYGAEPPTGHLDIRKPGAARLMKDIFSEIVHYLPGPYISTGNDEVNPHCYGFDAKDLNSMDTLLAPFVKDVHSHLVQLGKTPMVWEEAVLNFPNTAKVLKNGTIVEAWTTSSNVEKLLKASKDINLIHAPSDYFYLDCGMGSFLGNYANGNSWCPYVSWQKQYTFDPLNGTQNVPGSKERILGGESALWAEQVDEANVESLLWPRAAAGAEVFWTGADFTENKQNRKRSVVDALPRLLESRDRLRLMGIRASPLQPQWCAFHPGQCNMVSS